MEIPECFEVDGDPGDYVLECKKLIYVQNNAGVVKNKPLVAWLKQVGFMKCEGDSCILV
jgi:hypothetical protein